MDSAPSPPRRWLLPSVVAAGVLLHLPSLDGGLYADDHMHQLALDGHLPLAPWSLFDFGTTDDWISVRDQVGGFPWWTSPDWKIRFFRPLPSLSLWIDRAVWGTNASGLHATSLVWLAALLVATYLLHRALGLGRGVATAAVALLAASQSTVLPAGWIANRNSLLAAVFTTSAVAAVASHRRLGRGRSLALALALSTAAALSKESGVVSFALVGAWLVLAGGDLPAAWRRRAAAASLLCAAAWVVALGVAGFGTRSLFYATPWSDPLRFGANLALLGTVGSLAIVSPVIPDLVFVLPQSAVPLALVSVAVLVPLGIWAARRLREEPAARFLLAWTALALVPEAGAPPSDRLLLTASVGGSGLLALLLSKTLPRSAGRSRTERAAAWTIVLLAGGIEALATFGQSAFHARAADGQREAVLTADVGAPSLGRREVLVLQSDDPLVPFSMASTWVYHTRDFDVFFSVLQTGGRALRWTRDDDRTMTFESLGRPFVTDPFETVYRSSAAPPLAGTVVETPAFTVEVLGPASGADAPRVADSDPAGVRRLRLRFPVAPDSERFRFLVPRAGRLVHVAPPAPGETVLLPEVPPANPMLR